MINIVSQRSENSTDLVLEYIDWLGGVFNRVNHEDRFQGATVEISDSHEKILLDYGDERILDYSKVRNTWYRKGDYSINLPVKKESIKNDFVEKFLLDEWNFVKTFLHQNPKTLGGFTNELNNNKLLNLKYAKEAGINVPATMVTTKKNDLFKFIEKYSKAITKPIHNAHIGFIHEDKHLSSRGTQYVQSADLERLDDNFCPILIQEYVEKEIELRVFFIQRNLYPMAIFSQLDEKTRLDYRNYNNEKPNRNIPYQFSTNEERIIYKFIEMSGLNTGSIDLILSKKGNFVFLEVNPAGQFGWVSYNCNYYIEKAMALFLLNETAL